MMMGMEKLMWDRNVEIYEMGMVCFVFDFETRLAQYYGCGPDMFCFSIFVTRLCQVGMRGADVWEWVFDAWFRQICCC